MGARVYIETTVISYLTARPSQDVVIAGHQKVTRDWWDQCREKFEAVASQLVLREASAGDAQAAQVRIERLATLTLLEVTEEAMSVAQEPLATGAVPEQAAEDALHIAVAVSNGVEYLLTWNCKHLANAAMRTKIDDVCRSFGYDPVIICTPEELMEV